MNIPAFWRLIETTKAASDGNVEQQTDLLIRALGELPLEEMIQFDILLRRFRDVAYTNDLWAAAYILMGGCSNDGFADFRGWLVAQGESIFFAALHDPETLVEVVGEQIDVEAFFFGQHFGGAAQRAYEIASNAPMPTRNPVLELTGDEWTEEDLPARCPKLCAKYW